MGYNQDMQTYLEFEKPIAALEGQIRELRSVGGGSTGVDIVEEIHRLEGKVSEQIEKLYSDLDAWQKTQVARHPSRPPPAFRCGRVRCVWSPRRLASPASSSS